MRTRKNLYLFKVRKGLFMEDNEVKEYKKNNYIQKIITFAFMFCVFFCNDYHNCYGKYDE